MKHIPRYNFTQSDINLNIDFEIINLKVLFNDSRHIITKSHQLSFHQFIYITDGEGIHTIDFKDYSFSQYDIIPVIKDQVQTFHPKAGINGYVILFKSDFLINEKTDYKYLLNYTLFIRQLNTPVLKANNTIKTLLNLLLENYTQHSMFEYEEQLKNYLKLILANLEHQNRKASRCNEITTIALPFKFQQALEDNLSYKAKVSHICQQLQVSPNKLNTILQATFNQTAKQLMDERIILEIKRLLSYSELSIKEIAHKLQFDEMANLSNYFKKHTGYSPNQFRNNYQ